MMKLNAWLWSWIVFSMLWIGIVHVLAINSGKAFDGFTYFAIWAPPFFMLAIGYAVAWIRRGPQSN